MVEPFPLWLRVGHLANAIFIILLIRSGIEILSAHPKLYFHNNTPPGSEWIKFTRKKMPKDKLWTSDDEMESFHPVIALPGHSQLGMGRHWHFLSVIFWPLNGAVYYGLLFATGTWRTIIPSSWSIFADAWNAVLTFLSGHVPLPLPGTPFDGAQQLSYFIVVFVLGPFMILTGAAKSPAFAAQFPRFTAFFGGRQNARSLHFIVMVLFVLFILVHVTLVVVDHFQSNMANIILGGGEMSLIVAVAFFLAYLAVLAITNFLATKYSLDRPREVQKALGSVVEPVRRFLMGGMTSHQSCARTRITPFFRINGRPPETEEYEALRRDGFQAWRLKVNGLVERSLELSLDDIKSMQKSVQITEHTCIQGWTGAAEWAGVRVADVMERCRPKLAVGYVVFRSLAYGDLDPYGHGDSMTKFYEVIPMALARQDQTLLAYEMNGQPLTVPHGAPLRLRVEVQYGYKMVKWLQSIELIDDFSKVGAGRGGHREDSKHFDWGAWI